MFHIKRISIEIVDYRKETEYNISTERGTFVGGTQYGRYEYGYCKEHSCIYEKTK